MVVVLLLEAKLPKAKPAAMRTDSRKPHYDERVTTVLS